MSKLSLEYMTDELYAYKTLDELQEIFGYNRESIRQYALKKGWDQDWRWAFRWKEDEDILGENDYSYYFLGYFLGDGSLEKRNENYRNRYRVTIFSTETQVLSLLRDFLRIDSIKVRERQNRGLVNSWTREYRIDKNSKPIYQWLQSKGIVSNKSVTDVDIGNNVYNQNIYSFLRGLLDSDGTVYYNKPSSSRNVSWYGSKECIMGIAYILLEEGYKVNCGTHQGSVCYAKITNRSDIQRLYKNLYTSDMFMERK